MTEKSFSLLPEAYFDFLVRLIPGTVFVLALNQFRMPEFSWMNIVVSYLWGFVISLAAERSHHFFENKKQEFGMTDLISQSESDKNRIVRAGDLWKSLWIMEDSNQGNWTRVRVEQFPVLKKMVAELYMFRCLRLLAPVCFLLMLNLDLFATGWDQTICLLFTAGIILLFIKMPDCFTKRLIEFSDRLQVWSSILSLAALAIVLFIAYEIILGDRRLRDIAFAFEFATSLLVYFAAFGTASACFHIIHRHLIRKVGYLGLRFTEGADTPPES